MSKSIPADITEFLPKVKYPGLPGRSDPVVNGKKDSLATDQQEASEILKKFLPKPAKKKTVVKEAPAAKKTAGGKPAVEKEAPVGKPVQRKEAANKSATKRRVEAGGSSAKVSLYDILRNLEEGESNEN